MAIMTIGNVGALTAALGTTYQPSTLGGTPVAQWSQTPLPQVTFSGVPSSNMTGSALPPDRQLGTTLMQQQQDLQTQQANLETQRTLGQIDSATYAQQSANLQSELTKVQADWNNYSQQLQTYMSQPTRTQMMQAQVITGYSQANPTFSNPQEIWQHSSMRVLQNGQWVTLPEMYQNAYGGDPYADVATMKFQQLSLANQLVTNADKIQHVQTLAAKQPTSDVTYSSLPQVGPAVVNYAQPATNLGPLVPISLNSNAPTGGSVLDVLKPYLTPKNMAMALVAIALLLILSKAFGGSGKKSNNVNGKYAPNDDYGDDY